MKKNKAYDVSTYAFNSGERILIDANVWIYLQPPAAQPPPTFASLYSAALKNLITANAEPVIDALILSEYLNTYIRLEFNTRWKRHYPNFKAFRKSPDFSPIARAAIGDAKRVLNFTSLRETPLHLTNVSEILNETEAGTLDFNDAVLAESCRIRGWILLTHDSDMTIGGIEVLTSNRNLLKACP